MQVYLSDDLYEQVKTRHLPASELLQDAVRAEVRRQDLLGETDTYLARLLGEVGNHHRKTWPVPRPSPGGSPRSRHPTPADTGQP